MKTEKKDYSAYIVGTIHFVLAFSIPYLLMAFGACSEELKQTGPTLGQEIPAEQIQKLIMEGAGQTSPYDMQINEYAHLEDNLRVEMGSVTKVRDVQTLIFDRKQNEEGIRFVIRIRETNYTSDQVDTVDKEEIMDLPHLTSSAPNTDHQAEVQALSHLPEVQALVKRIQSLDPRALNLNSQFVAHQGTKNFQPQAVKRVSFHGLLVKRTKVSPPKAVAESPTCGGLAVCELRAIELQFDIAEWTSDTDFTKSRIKFTLSPDIPYSASQLSLCRSQMIGIEGTDYFVTQCQVLRDFEFGAAD